MNNPYDKILSKSGENRYLIAPKTVYKFFTEGLYFRRIPDYQRPYSWSTQNVEDLLKDVSKISKAESGSWFLGPLFSVIENQNTEWADLLDGQQRVTTIQIILREASLVLFEEQGLDQTSHPELFRNMNRIIDQCKRCLIKTDNFEDRPVFYTENSIKQLFEDYILGFNEITDSNNLKRKRDEFKQKALNEAKEGSKTAKRILESITEVQKYFKDNFFNHSKSVEERYSQFFKFIKSLLWDCWLLEIPLEQHKYSTQIFESINNRGKSLSLVDKLRYKSIIFLNNESLLDDIKVKWKKIYSGTERLDDRGFIKNEDDFFKVFFNSYKGSDFTKEYEFIKLFETEFAASDKDIVQFLDDALSIIQFYDILSASMSPENDFVKLFETRKQNMVRSLMELFKKALRVSDNSRLLLFQLIRHHKEFHENQYVIVPTLWNIIKLVVVHEVLANTKSNEVRTDYMQIVEDIHNGDYTYMQLIVKNEDLFSTSGKPIINLVRTTNNDEAKLLLYFYTYCKDHNNLIAGSDFQYKKSELDHLFPKAWKLNWSEKKFSKQDVIDTIESTDMRYFNSLSKQHLIDSVIVLDGVELKDYESRPFKTPNCLIEFIGNKWVLNDSTNASTGNGPFEEKKQKYTNSNFIKVPKNDAVEIGMDSFNNFGHTDIIKRTIILVNGILECLVFQWDEVD